MFLACLRHVIAMCLSCYGHSHASPRLCVCHALGMMLHCLALLLACSCRVLAIVAMLLLCFALSPTCCCHILAMPLPCPCRALAMLLPCLCHDLALLWPRYCLALAMLLPSHCHCDALAMHLPCSRRHGLAMFLLLALASLCALRAQVSHAVCLQEISEVWQRRVEGSQHSYSRGGIRIS